MDSGNPFQLIDVLLAHNVPLVIIDGHAVAFHGHVRATEDIDLIFRRTVESETALLDGLKSLNAQWIGDQVDSSTGLEETHPVSAPYIRSNRLMMLVTDFGFLDLFDYVPGLPSASIDDLFDAAIEVDGRRFASLDWLRKMKQAAGRPQDLLDLDHLPPA